MTFYFIGVILALVALLGGFEHKIASGEEDESDIIVTLVKISAMSLLSWMAVVVTVAIVVRERAKKD